MRKAKPFRPTVPYSKDFGLFLQSKRLNAGLSQGQLSQELGYGTPQVISNWERGMQSPPFDVLVRLSTVLSIPKQELLNRLLDEHEKLYMKTWKQRRLKTA